MPSSLRMLLVVCLLVVGCGGAPTPTFDAGDLSAVQEALALRGARIVNAVSGDPGCPDSPLHSNVVRLDVELPAGREQQIHLFRWRRPAQFDDAGGQFAACVEAAAAGDPETAPIAVVELPPWRAYGRGWSDELRLALEDALRAAGGG